MIDDTLGSPARPHSQQRVETDDVMLREANHRIANSLQAVMAASMALPGPTRADVAAARKQMTTRIAAIATVHRMLSVSNERGLIAFGGYLEELVENLRLQWVGCGASRIVLQYTGEMVEADIAVRFGMVINELVTNSCKYAYADDCAGEIRIGFSVSGDRFVLIVADDGQGIDVNDSQPGMGTRLIADLAQRLEASFAYHPGRLGTIAALSGPAELLRSKGRRRSSRGPSYRVPVRDVLNG